ncbi:hypothetical protein BV22DRAFT_999966 [Leucogyrophana mollusca]|uniref:Uncharacterized protein n=1 Tax=Leucogyrophana mollusca TaxID=85980 RepID=A0ACB8BYH1_9AGAM|nr:hypothetical protein BV22DRAFT_999966 [Leucogyrophana mollusca]
MPRGKKRAREETPVERGSSSESSAPPDPPPVKKPKRAETKPCPACGELIPVRLLAAHNELELQRVEEIIRNVGSTDVLADDLEEGPSSKSRRSAVKARKSLSAMNPQSDVTNTVEVTGKAIQVITRRRKQRHAKLKEMSKDDELSVLQEDGSGQAICPVCSQTVRGDRDVVEAHVDACLAHESQRLREQDEREEEFVDVGNATMRVTDGVNLNGTGIHVRSENDQDVDDEVDVDGDDEAMFGNAQFTEGDILGATTDSHEAEIDIEGEPIASGSGTHQTLRDLVAEGKIVGRGSSENVELEGVKAKMVEVMGLGDMDKTDLAIVAARKQSDSAPLILALENKIKQLESMRVSSSTSSLCRICLDPYTEPTVSTGCWHTCCRECWLRCLGSTKLCPICKRITAAADLRRVYL